MAGRFNKDQNRYLLKKAKEAAANAKFLAELAKCEIPIAQPRTLQFRSTTDKLLGVLLFATVTCSLISPSRAGHTRANPHEPTCGPGDLKNQSTCGKSSPSPFNITHDGVDISRCNYLYDKIARVSERLPDAANMFARVFAQPNFSFKCVKKNKMPGASAAYSQHENQIYYPAAEGAEQEGVDDADLHHEMIHADTARRHRTPHCNPDAFSNDQVNQLIKKYPDHQKSAREGVPVRPLFYASPIWPPTEANRKQFFDLVRQDLQSEKNQALAKLHKKKISDEKLTPAENETYTRYSERLGQCIIVENPIRLGISPADAAAYRSNRKPLPTSVVLEGGVAVHQIRLARDNQGRDYLAATIKDPVSSHIYLSRFAMQQFQELKDVHPFSAVAELDANLRMGMPDTVLKEFYPNLWAHLKREEACCDHGVTSQCYNRL